MNSLDEIIADYNTGQYTIKMLARKYGISVGKIYYLLRDAGCKFIRKRRAEYTQEEKARRSEAHKGHTMSDKSRKKISEKNSCNYNGLNGYGHTKKQNNGYMLVYVPKHPNAHGDGYAMFHTVLMEQKLGRYLKRNEVVHHINHDREDNRIENLLLMDKKEHMKMHMKERHEKRRNDLSIHCTSSEI